MFPLYFELLSQKAYQCPSTSESKYLCGDNDAVILQKTPTPCILGA